MTVLFRADLQNTLIPEVGTFDDTSNKSGSFGLDHGEYYLQNSAYSKAYYYYYLLSGSDNSTLSITFNIAITDTYAPNGWSILFIGNAPGNWWGIFTRGSYFYIETATGSENLGYYSTATWHTIKIVQDISLGTLKIKVYVNNEEKADISRNASFALTKILLLGNETTSWAASGTILKNILITDGTEPTPTPVSGDHKYLDYTGLQTLVTDIINYHTAHTVDAYSKTEIDNMLLNYYRNDGFGISSFGLSYFGGRG